MGYSEKYNNERGAKRGMGMRKLGIIQEPPNPRAAVEALERREPFLESERISSL